LNLAAVFIRRPVFAVMLIASMVVFGLVSYKKVGVDMFPDVEFPVVTVLVIYPGADPVTMETKVADKIEEAVNTLGGIRELRSVNLEGVTQVIAMFELEVKADQVVQDIRDRVARIERDLPEGIDPPTVQKWDIGATPVLTVALAGNLPIRQLTHLGDKTVKQRLERIRGVGGVDLVGGRDREIQVLVDPGKLSGVGLTVGDVAMALQAQNLEIPGGSFQSGGQEVTVKTKGQVRTAREIADILIPVPMPAPIRIRDVAQVVDGIEKAKSSSTLNGQPAVSLVVRKQSGANTVEVAHALKEAVRELEPEVKKAGASIMVARDNSLFIERAIGDTLDDVMIGGVLAVLIIFLMLLDPRITLISAVAIPTSVIATFAFIKAMGFTFNMLTMLALSLSIGILIDDAIVVIENIHRHLEEGKPAMQAAGDATREIFLAVLAMTSTILAVFVPVAFMKGIVGRFFYQFGLTVSFAVATSMVVSFTLTPMLASRLLKPPSEEHPGLVRRTVNGFMEGLERIYGTIIRWSLRHRLATLGVAIAALVASGVLVKRIKLEFMTSMDRGEVQISVETPTGTSLDATTRVVTAIADDLRKRVAVETVLASVAGGDQGQINQGSIEVKLPAKKSRDYSQNDFMQWVRQRYGKLPHVKVAVLELNTMGGGSGMRNQPVQYNIRGSDLEELEQAAEKLRAELARVPGIVDLDTTYRGGKPELSLTVDRDRAAALNVPVAAVATTIRSLVAGDKVSTLQDGTDLYDIIIKMQGVDQGGVESLSNLKVRAPGAMGQPQLVDLANLIKSQRTFGPSQIERQSRQRQVTLVAGLSGLPLGAAMEAVDQAAKKVIPSHLTTEFGGQGKFMGESFGYMLEALILAVILVYMILAAQFDSFIQPLTIMISLPLSFVGAFGALYLSGMTLSMFSMIGIIMLMGLVTKNAILLVDFANQKREAGEGMLDALAHAGELRLRPILMTTAAMVFGMLPVALALSEGGDMRAPMAVCVIGGLLTSTLLTLVVVPVVYTLFEGMTRRLLGPRATDATRPEERTQAA
jgi:hydrophobic/amphiphilic exporter-1 (mainly G- bacteria), HAE1 family